MQIDNSYTQSEVHCVYYIGKTTSYAVLPIQI
jgi:hypothetical protein